ncbi:hypothetical protein BDK51DRAFT_27613 [Blyttiomyces helicus]|uniref:Uncharacterized protein n=1 Tax=Blyttiomyces helicus TaxID=388810 RepID=A0A4P9WM64_9FUNG|nr:hypothetical protein BDK51DRAFT_27613 [Blyttiomyces helicus]|eukprot:RKO92260.1 hypothetical protein BDK51DRAFT_27613 [Blyttiomyces helicus]
MLKDPTLRNRSSAGVWQGGQKGKVGSSGSGRGWRRASVQKAIGEHKVARVDSAPSLYGSRPQQWHEACDESATSRQGSGAGGGRPVTRLSSAIVRQEGFLGSLSFPCGHRYGDSQMAFYFAGTMDRQQISQNLLLGGAGGRGFGRESDREGG